MAGTKVTRVKAEAAASAIDWAAIDAMSDADIERQVEENPDAASDRATETAKRIWMSRKSVKDRIRGLRAALQMSRRQFAVAYHIPERTLEGWEQGTRIPDQGSMAFLKTIAFMPDRTRAVINYVGGRAA